MSAHLHEWIDLVFGFKQFGRHAEEANNVFHYLTYEKHAPDLETIENKYERKGIEDQIKYMGQTPSQLLFTPHPARLSIKAVSEPICSSPESIKGLAAFVIGAAFFMKSTKW